jgi:Tfp pilus assembly protein PilF
MLDTREGQFDAAENHLQESLQLAEACAAPFEQALTLLEMARLRMAEGKNAEAQALLAEVRALCEPLEAKPTLERVAELEQRLAGTA